MLSELAANASADAIGRLCDGGSLCLYDDADNLLAEPRFQSIAFRDAAGGVAEAFPLRPDPSAPASGVATRYRLLTAGGEEVLDGTAGESDADLILTTATISKGVEVSVDEYRLTAKRG